MADAFDKILGTPDDNPPVHPHLVEHLREKFSRPAPSPFMSAETCHAQNHQQFGMEAVIDYLETLITKGDTPDEPFPTEGASTDPRRPGTRSRG